jgi:hypothetical protein
LDAVEDDKYGWRWECERRLCHGYRNYCKDLIYFYKYLRKLLDAVESDKFHFDKTIYLDEFLNQNRIRASKVMGKYN